jgi:hypothetical protein
MVTMVKIAQRRTIYMTSLAHFCQVHVATCAEIIKYLGARKKKFRKYTAVVKNKKHFLHQMHFSAHVSTVIVVTN